MTTQERSGPTAFKIMHRLLILLALLFGVGYLSGGPAASPKGAPRIVFLIGEDEYQTWETLPEFAKSELENRGARCRIIQSDPADRNNFPGLEAALADADLLVLSTRRRTPRKEQLAAVRRFLEEGKPLVGIRTACHAFARRADERAALEAGLADWPGFDPEVLGGHYTGHHGAGPKSAISAAPGVESHPILRQVQLSKLEGNGSLYRVSPLARTTHVVLIGETTGKPPEPVAWTHAYGPRNARIFYTSLGHPDDFKNPEFRRLLKNGVYWALDRAAPPESGRPGSDIGR